MFEFHCIWIFQVSFWVLLEFGHGFRQVDGYNYGPAIMGGVGYQSAHLWIHFHK